MLGSLIAERIRHAHHDQAVDRERAEALYGPCPPLVVTHLLEIPDHQNRSVRVLRQRDLEEERLQVTQVADVVGRRGTVDIPEHLRQDVPMPIARTAEQGSEPAALLGQDRSDGDGLVQIVDVGERGDRAVPADCPR